MLCIDFYGTPAIFGVDTTPPQIAANIASCPYWDEAAPAMIARTKKMIVTMKVKSPYGIAKHGFFNFPVAHPRIATMIPQIPTATTNLPISAPASSPGILNCFF